MSKKTEKYLSEDGISVSRLLPKDTVLVVCIGATIGKTALTWAEKSATNQQINAILPNEKVVPHFLYYSLRFKANELPTLAGRAAIPIVNKSNFSKFRGFRKTYLIERFIYY
jgi:type I restriction enzyme S subunit